MSNRIRILVVDDDASVREVITDVLAEFGYTVRQASGGAEALEMLADGLRPDIVITDHNMPGMEGEEVAKAIKTGYPGIAVVLASSMHINDLARMAREAGADGFLSKPFRCDDLQELVERLIPKPE